MLVAGYSAYPRRVNFAKMREIADEVGATLMVDMAHFAGLVAGKVFTGDEDPVPHAHITTTTTHKSLRGPRGGLVLAQQEYADSVDRGCPMVLGGPLSHVMAAKAVALAEARQPEFQTYAQAIADNAKSLAEGFLSRGAKLVTGGTDNHIVLLDVSSFGLTGRQAESALLDAGVVTNRNSVPSRPQRRLVHLRRPARLAGAHHPRVRARRVRHRGRADRARAAEHPARHHQGRRPVEGVVHAGRGRGREGPGRLGRDARQAPALPGSRARLIGWARAVIGVQLLLGTAVLVLAAVGYAGERDALVVVAVLLVGSVGLSQVLPALVSVVLLRRDRTGAALLVSGIAAFVPGVMIVFLTLTSNPDGQASILVAFGLVLAGLGFHQLVARSRLA